MVFWTKFIKCEIKENISEKQIILCLATLSRKNENVIANIAKKSHNFVKTN